MSVSLYCSTEALSVLDVYCIDCVVMGSGGESDLRWSESSDESLVGISSPGDM